MRASYAATGVHHVALDHKTYPASSSSRGPKKQPRDILRGSAAEGFPGIWGLGFSEWPGGRDSGGESLDKEGSCYRKIVLLGLVHSIKGIGSLFKKASD